MLVRRGRSREAPHDRLWSRPGRGLLRRIADRQAGKGGRHRRIADRRAREEGKIKGSPAGSPVVATRGGKRLYQPSLAFVHPFPLGTPKVDSPSQRRQGTAERGKFPQTVLNTGGGGAGRVLVCDPPPPAPPPPRVLKDSGARSATNKCPWRKVSGAKGADFFFILCVYTQNTENFLENSYLC